MIIHAKCQQYSDTMLKTYLTLLLFLWQDRDFSDKTEIIRCSNNGSCLQRGWQQSLQTEGHPNWIPSYRLVFQPSTEIVLWQMLKMSWGRYSTRLSMTCLCNISEMNYAIGTQVSYNVLVNKVLTNNVFANKIQRSKCYLPLVPFLTVQLYRLNALVFSLSNVYIYYI